LLSTYVTKVLHTPSTKLIGLGRTSHMHTHSHTHSHTHHSILLFVPSHRFVFCCLQTTENRRLDEEVLKQVGGGVGWGGLSPAWTPVAP
jgi:hypothetical protein